MYLVTKFGYMFLWIITIFGYMFLVDHHHFWLLHKIDDAKCCHAQHICEVVSGVHHPLG